MIKIKINQADIEVARDLVNTSILFPFIKCELCGIDIL